MPKSIADLSYADLPFADLLQLSTLSIATAGADGQPHNAPVYFVAGQDFHLYFFSAADSQHGRDIDYEPRAAISIYPECRDWQDIHGLQMRGGVHPVDPGPEWDAAWEQYQAKFPFVASLKEIVSRNTLYAFIPRWIRLVDNRRGFGYKEEWELA